MNGQFFSVHINCTIKGSKFRHGICYKMNDWLAPIVTQMEKEGTATIYSQEVRIVSGVAHPCIKDIKREQEPIVAFTHPPSVAAQSSAPAIFPADAISEEQES